MQAASQSPTTAPAAARRSTSSPAHPINAAPSQRCALHLTRRPLQHTVGKEAKGQEEKCLQVLGRTWRSSVLWQCKHLEWEVTGACTPAPRRAAAARVSLACLHARRSAKGDGHLRSRRARKQQRPTTHNQRKPTHRRRTWLASRDPSCVRPVCAVVLVSWCWCARRRREARGRQRRCWLRTAPVAARPVARPSVRRWCRDDPQSQRKATTLLAQDSAGCVAGR